MNNAQSDTVQNHVPVSDFARNHNPPLFFIGATPSQALSVINPDHPAAGVMISVNQLRKRKSDFPVGDWLMDSGAFTEVARNGGFSSGVEEYAAQIARWRVCGNLMVSVSQDWMCEAFVLERTGLSVERHQQLTIERYDALLGLEPPVPIMPVLQGYASSDYLVHLYQYGDRLRFVQWVGVGSVCRRNGNPGEILNILRGIKLIRPDLRLHGFGLKAIALENPEIRELLYSCDSMAWSYPARFDSVQNRTTQDLAHDYQKKISDRLHGSYDRPVPRTAGAGNGQGRKPKWQSQTKAIRVPAKYAERLLALAREWEKSAGDE